MKYQAIIAAAIISTTVNGQIEFELGACKGSMLQSIYNDSMVWDLWVEPYVYETFETMENRFEIHGESPNFVRYDQGSRWTEFTATEKGIYHFLLKNEINGALYAYIVIVVEHQAESYFKGAKKNIRAYKANTEFAVWAPFQENVVDGLYPPGLLY
jgi:hypothetical protein